MTNGDLIETVIAEKHKLDTIERRVDKLELVVDRINDLTISVHDMATTMKHMLDEQKEQSERLSALEAKPAEAWNTIQKTILTAIVSACAGGVAVWLVHGIAQYI